MCEAVCVAVWLAVCVAGCVCGCVAVWLCGCGCDVVSLTVWVWFRHNRTRCQGNLNNCWLIGGMQLLASNSKTYKFSKFGTILAASPNADGDVEAQLFIGGEWRSYKVTKQIPATSEGDKMSPLYAHPPNEAEGPPVVWGTMAEKIVAKAYGGYGVCGNAKLPWRGGVYC